MKKIFVIVAAVVLVVVINFFYIESALALCDYSLSLPGFGYSSQAASASFTVTPSPSSCTWTATSHASWIHITSGSSGTGNGTVSYSVDANTTGDGRAGWITIGGQGFVIRQAKDTFIDGDLQPDFTPYIYAIYAEGITTGYGNGYYGPPDQVTRGQMAAFIIRSLYGENFSYTTTPYFSDVPSTHPFFKYVQMMKDTGLTTVSGTYMVDGIVTRGQMAAFIIRALYGEDFDYTQTPYFSDVPDTPIKFFKYVQKMKDIGITAVSGTYMVDDFVTRGQMAAFLARAFLGMQIGIQFTQDDLTGVWDYQNLTTGYYNYWFRATITIDSSGNVTYSSCLSSTGNTTCPAAGSITWTIDGSGVISASNNDTFHATMTSRKNFIAATQTSYSNSYTLIIAQKVVPGTVYSNADLQNQSVVFHELNVGYNNYWARGAGTTDASGLMTLTSVVGPSGPETPDSPGTISVDANGVVTISGAPHFQGFLSSDKKTIVATATSGTGNSYRLIVFQITGQTHNAGPVPVGLRVSHVLASGPTPFWYHCTSTTASGGILIFSEWVASNPAVTKPGTTYNYTIDASGTVTQAENSSYNGQTSYDRKFTVFTETTGTSSSYYLLGVSIR